MVKPPIPIGEWRAHTINTPRKINEPPPSFTIATETFVAYMLMMGGERRKWRNVGPSNTEYLWLHWMHTSGIASAAIRQAGEKYIKHTAIGAFHLNSPTGSIELPHWRINSGGQNSIWGLLRRETAGTIKFFSRLHA